MRTILRILIAGATALGVPAAAQDARLTGRVAVLGAPAQAVTVTVRAEAWSDSLRLPPDGAFEIGVPPGVPLRLDVRSAGRTHLPASVVLDSAAPVALVLVPRAWRITGGRYDGRVVEVRPEQAFGASCEGCPVFFHRMWRRPAGETLRWGPGVLPLPVAFDRPGSRERITAADSSAFWRAVAAMEADAGLDLFRPTRYALVADDPENVVLVWQDPSLTRFDAWTSVGAGDDGIITTSSLALRSFGLLRRPSGGTLVVHELVHALGFGHTCGWASVVSARGCGSRSEGLSAHDVAYLQLGIAVQEAAGRLGIPRPWVPTLAALHARTEPVLAALE